MSKIIGIDLGTTNSAVAFVQDGRPQILPRGEERLVPSVVGYAGKGQWLVGTPARNQYVLSPENTVRSIKRKMGSEETVEMAGRPFTPQEISAFILRELKTIAEQNLGEEVSEAVITVPAYFTDVQRQATINAGEIAGLKVRRIINEPTAAALAYGLNKAEDQLVLVYDLGGGTFDVSLVELMGGIVEVRASHGNTKLGGDDFDERLANEVADRFAEEHDVDLRQERKAWARLLRAAEMAKIELSDHPYVWIKEEYLTEKDGIPLHLEYEIDRRDFEVLIEDLLEETRESIDQVLADAEVTAEEIDQILLVGGSTRIPLVWQMVARHLDLEPQMSVNPDEVVALGAGVQAAIIAGQPIDAILVDVTPHSLGIAIAEFRLGRVVSDRYKPLIRRNTTIPVTKEEVFYTMYPGQDTIRVEVYQGEKPIASQNTALGEFLVTDLESPSPDENAEITVSFDLNVDGMLTVTARDRQSDNEEKITVEATKARLSEAEILAARNRLSEMAVPDDFDEADLEEMMAMMQEAGTDTAVALDQDTQLALEQAEDLLAEEELSDEQRQALQNQVAQVRQVAEAGDGEAMAEETEALWDILFDLEDI